MMLALTAQVDPGAVLALPLLHERLELPDGGRDVGGLLRPLLPEVLLQAPTARNLSITDSAASVS